MGDMAVFRDIASKLDKTSNRAIPNAVITRAKELSRLAEAKFSSIKMGKKMKMNNKSLPAVCSEIACRENNIGYDRKVLSQIAGIGLKAYETLFQRVQNTLGITFSIDISQIAIKLGVEDLIQPTRTMLDTFKSSYSEHSRQNMPDFTRPAYNVAALYLSSEKAKKPIDKKVLLQYTGVNGGEFKQICEHISAQRPSQASNLNAKKSSSRFKRKQEAEKTVANKKGPSGSSTQRKQASPEKNGSIERGREAEHNKKSANKRTGERIPASKDTNKRQVASSTKGPNPDFVVVLKGMVVNENYLQWKAEQQSQ